VLVASSLSTKLRVSLASSPARSITTLPFLWSTAGAGGWRGVGGGGVGWGWVGWRAAVCGWV
jgi:hypothetical protein